MKIGVNKIDQKSKVRKGAHLSRIYMILGGLTHFSSSLEPKLLLRLVCRRKPPINTPIAHMASQGATGKAGAKDVVRR